MGACIDWEWYDDIVAGFDGMMEEYDEMVRREKEMKENLLIDFDELSCVHKSDIQKELEILFA